MAAQDINPIAYLPGLFSHAMPDLYPVQTVGTAHFWTTYTNFWQMLSVLYIDVWKNSINLGPKLLQWKFLQISHLSHLYV